MPDTLKITNTLADETRYSIYQYIVKEKKQVSVLEIADQFGIHPNVARLHLTKLNDSKLVSSQLANNKKGGRPARVYFPAEDPIYLSFPKQENHLLLQWLLKLVDSMGEEALRKAKEISYQHGRTIIKHVPSSTQTFESKMELFKEAANAIGYIPHITENEDKKVITFSIYNCPYKDQLHKYPALVCSLHESFLKGQFDALFPTNKFLQIESMQNHCNNCVYQIEVL
ncbi:metalloregulator ArsR/SmtB family transcription factor [Psychrobacillus sp. OK032]|uniref:helix-turn-helix transcriptional regulator n=1 Tax=Psychrobacillus sp. OK032 TaxID=1884358 RepID=UPI0008C77DCD|nr:helix-turn-helix domain-containing protein [Psychrobacillus sp. OK032]SER81081.1 Predicted transcriptional regulator, ArsR family [Psychrobacillus sp. OK032]